MSKSRKRPARATRSSMKYRIKELRLARGLTQEQLAQLAGTNKGYISQLETGAREPSAETLRSLAAAFGVDAVQLIEPGSQAGLGAMRLLEAFERLSPEDQATVQALAERLAPKKDG